MVFPLLTNYQRMITHFAHLFDQSVCYYSFALLTVQVHIVIQNQSAPWAMYTSRTPPHGQCPVTEKSNPPSNQPALYPTMVPLQHVADWHCGSHKKMFTQLNSCNTETTTQWAWPYACSKGKRILILQPQQGMLMMPSLDTAGLTSESCQPCATLC